MWSESAPSGSVSCFRCTMWQATAVLWRCFGARDQRQCHWVVVNQLIALHRGSSAASVLSNAWISIRLFSLDFRWGSHLSAWSAQCLISVTHSALQIYVLYPKQEVLLIGDRHNGCAWHQRLDEKYVTNCPLDVTVLLGLEGPLAPTCVCSWSHVTKIICLFPLKRYTRGNPDPLGISLHTCCQCFCVHSSTQFPRFECGWVTFHRSQCTCSSFSPRISQMCQIVCILLIWVMCGEVFTARVSSSSSQHTDESEWRLNPDVMVLQMNSSSELPSVLLWQVWGSWKLLMWAPVTGD